VKVPILTEHQKIEFSQKEEPEIQKGEALVKVEYCGISERDLQSYLKGITVQFGTVMGHECSGKVAEVGEGIKNVKIGDPVAVRPFAQCGKCYWCQRGKFLFCSQKNQRTFGITPEQDGAFAPYVKIRYPHEMLFPLPARVSFEGASLIDPLAISLHGLRLSRFKSGDFVVVIGAGVIGLGIVEFLKLGKADKIIVIEVSSKKSEIAVTLGADLVFNPISGGKDLKDNIINLTDGIGADIIFDCTGKRNSIQNAINYVKCGGEVMVVGISDGELQIEPMSFIQREVEIKGVLNYYDEFERVLDLMSQGRINWEILISDIISLDDIEEKGFKRLVHSQDEIRILVKP
jgi:(R,R)-butanediol dehydrogenase / meso-butanediol dehydrogenase / diacetyl reductase